MIVLEIYTRYNSTISIFFLKTTWNHWTEKPKNKNTYILVYNQISEN